MNPRLGTGMVTFSRVVRISTRAVLSSMVMAMMLLALMSSSLFGLSRNVKQLQITSETCGWANNFCAPPNTPQLREAISRQSKLGLDCAIEPVLTDVILFQRSEDLSVDVLTLDQALDAVDKKVGWVQRYCR